MTAALAAGCSSGHSSPDAVGRSLAPEVLPAPGGYRLDQNSKDEYGVIEPSVFAAYGGVGSASRYHFQGGFRANYVSYGTGEGLSITILRFGGASDARRYLQDSAGTTLSFEAPTQKPFTPIPGAIEVDATKVYSGNFSHAIVMTNGGLYAQVVYLTEAAAQAPIELYSWAREQFNRLK